MTLPYPERPLLADNLDLAAVPSASGTARMFTKATLMAWRASWLIENATLIVAELVTNAIKATGVTTEAVSYDKLTTINLRILGFREVIFFEVWDCDARLPIQGEAGPDSETGRGLTIVQALASRWGVYPAPNGGKVVWAEVPVRRRQPNGYRNAGPVASPERPRGELEPPAKPPPEPCHLTWRKYVHPNADHTYPLSWGWFAIAHNIDGGHWLYPGEAAQLVGIPGTTLHYWADAGVISRIQFNPGERRRYLQEELEVVAKVIADAGVRPTLWFLKQHIIKSIGGTS